KSLLIEERSHVRAARKKERGTFDLVFRRGVRRTYNGPRFGLAPSGAPHVQGACVTLAEVAQLYGELSVHRDLLGYSPPSPALCHRGHSSAHVVQLRASVFRVAASTFHRLDGRESVGAAACRLLCRGLLPRKRHLHILDLGAY